MGLESLDSVIFGVGIYCVWCEEGLRESNALSKDARRDFAMVSSTQVSKTSIWRIPPWKLGCESDSGYINCYGSRARLEDESFARIACFESCWLYI